MQRFSRGAVSKFSRKKSYAQLHEGSGPVIIRRRGDSRTRHSHGNPWDAAETDSDELDSASSPAPASSEDSRSPSRKAFDGGIAPKVDMLLQRGCLLTKVSKQRQKLKTVYLDVDAAKIYWDLVNPAKQIYIDQIMGFHVGEAARNYRVEQQVPAEYESRWFSIIHACPERSIPIKTTHLIAPDEKSFEAWTTALDEISRYRIGLMSGLAGISQPKAILQTYWDREVARQAKRPSTTSAASTSSSTLSDYHSSSSEDGDLLNFSAIEALCKSVHVNCSRSALHAAFSAADLTGLGRLNFAQFQEVLRKLKTRRDIYSIFQTVASDPQQGLSLSDFLHFLSEVQGEDVGKDSDRWSVVFE
ncbi:Phospholipase C, partial [Ascosphaera acerosa]